MTRCKKPTDNATRTDGYDPCGKTKNAAMGYTYMGYSVRSNSWRYTLWAKWNVSTLCPEWRHESNEVELYDHQNDGAMVNFDDFENINVAGDVTHAAVLEKMAGIVQSSFGGERCRKSNE